MPKEKLYFENKDSTSCRGLSGHLNDAKLAGLKEIILIEANLDNSTDEVWCIFYGESVGRCECKKSFCNEYTSKSGRGVCEHRGNLYFHGQEVKFTVE